MHREQPTDTPAQRVRWAIEHDGRTLEQIAARMGCRGATLSQWQHGHTDMMNAKIGLVMAFCDQTRVRLEWLLEGKGPARPTYPVTRSSLVSTAQEIVARYPALVPAAERVLRALEESAADADAASASNDDGHSANHKPA